MISSARALMQGMNLKEEAEVKLYRAYGYGFRSLSKNNEEGKSGYSKIR